MELPRILCFSLLLLTAFSLKFLNFSFLVAYALLNTGRNNDKIINHVHFYHIKMDRRPKENPPGTQTALAGIIYYAGYRVTQLFQVKFTSLD